MNNSSGGERGHVITEQLPKFVLKDLCASKKDNKKEEFQSMLSY